MCPSARASAFFNSNSNNKNLSKKIEKQLHRIRKKFIFEELPNSSETDDMRKIPT